MKPVKGFEDYKVTKDGEVFDKNGRKLTVGRDNQGYATVTMRKDGKSYTRRLHRVVGETYLKPIEGKNIINHKDGDKSHCRLVNLEYMSNSENTKHGYDNGFYRSRSNLPVIVIDKDGKEAEFTSIRGLSRELGLNRKTVSSILNSGRNNNYDYTFKYKELEKKGATDMKYSKMLDEMYMKKQANEDDDGVQVCNNCGKPISYKGEPGSCNCNGGKGTSSKKEFLENRLADKLASEVLNELYLEKQAANEVGPVDWSKQKTIPLASSEFKVRDAKLGEAIGHNAKQGAKAAGRGAKAGAKAGIKGAKNYAKLVKAAPMAGVLPAAAGLVVANNVHQYKKREKSRDNDTKTDAMKDKVIPENIRSLKTMPLAMAGGLAGATVGPKAGIKVGGRLANKVALKAGLKGTKALKALKAGAVTGAVAGAVTPIVGAGVASNELKKRDSLKKLDKLSNKYLGRPATEAEKKVIRDRNKLTTPAYKRGGVTPESEVQKRRRAMAKKNKQEKKASDILEELFLEKQAGNIEEAIKSNPKQYCMNCANASKERYRLEDKHYVKADPQDKDGEYLKCSLVNDYFKKEHGKDCAEFEAKKQEKKASDILNELYLEKQAGNINEDLSNQLKGMKDVTKDTANNMKDLKAQGEALKSNLGSLAPKSEGIPGYNKGPKLGIKLGQKAKEAENVAEVAGDVAKKAPKLTKGLGAGALGAGIATGLVLGHMKNKAKEEKTASEYLDMIYKEAMDKGEKWSKKDKRGFLRNMAINTAQDFVNAGNPLNVGSHIVGSVLDSAVMEGMTMKMNKKLQAQKINERKLSQFNDAKGLSNGTTAVKAVKSTPQAVKKITHNNN